ncbi:NUDIX domain-containing protein [Carboxylicivirga sp. N1Y90]|uniref:NUDIX domain-containing protein n=1 Tax=Carboxylicivirga fragile TaxID=3417571 RepID=UPI003D35953D|nr:NUDIX domain-containing protein [Marinilabiliaceae bacterium N1Y90]
MNKFDLLKRLLPGFLPIIVFIVVDEIWGTLYGLVVAITVGVIELAYSYIKERKIDRFVIFDVGLLVALGAVSILLDNEVFFKLKPGIISLLMTGLIGFSAFSKHNLLLQMTKRYMKQMQMNPYQLWEVQNSMKRIFWVLLLYSLAALISAFIENKAIWTFLNGPGLFVIMGLYFAFEWFIKKQQNTKYKNEEWLPLVNEKGQVLGSAPRSVVHSGSRLLHPVVHLHVFNKGQLLLQKRATNKMIQPGKWDTAVGGHVSAGENIEQALKKEAFEEIGLTQFNQQTLQPYIWESEIEKELVFLFRTKHKGTFKKADDEVDELRFWSMSEINDNIGKGIFTPNFEHEYNLFFRST